MEIKNIELQQGTTWDIQVSVVDSDGAAFNLVGFSARAQMRKSFSSPLPTATFDCSVVDADQGILNLHLSALLSKQISRGTYAYGVEIFKIVSGEEIVYCPVSGNIEVKPEATK